MIGILCAMDEEMKYLLDEMKNSESRRMVGYDYICGELRGRRVVLCKCGIGKINAAVCLQTMLMTWPEIRLVINSGVAGSLREPLEIGDVCVARDVVQHDVDTTALGDPAGFVSTINQTYFLCAEWAVEKILKAARDEKLQAYPVRIASGDQFISNVETKNRIVRTFDADACEMEGGAVAQVCFINGVDCVVLRAISDSSSGKHEMEYREFLMMAAKNGANVLLRFLGNIGADELRVGVRQPL